MLCTWSSNKNQSKHDKLFREIIPIISKNAPLTVLCSPSSDVVFFLHSPCRETGCESPDLFYLLLQTDYQGWGGEVIYNLRTGF